MKKLITILLLTIIASNAIAQKTWDAKFIKYKAGYGGESRIEDYDTPNFIVKYKVPGLTAGMLEVKITAHQYFYTSNGKLIPEYTKLVLIYHNIITATGSKTLKGESYYNPEEWAIRWPKPAYYIYYYEFDVKLFEYVISTLKARDNKLTNRITVPYK